jgi:hypothetical protein
MYCSVLMIEDDSLLECELCWLVFVPENNTVS